MPYVKRSIEDKLIEASRFSPVVMMCGPSQSGKKTLVRRVIEKIGVRNVTYVSLRDEKAFELAAGDPDFFFDRYRPPLVIEEIHLAPSLLPAIQCFVDDAEFSDAGCETMFWLTSSQNFAMMKNATESLAGRCTIFDLSFLSAAELDGRFSGVFTPDMAGLKKRMSDCAKKSTDEMFDRIFRGGMPGFIAMGRRDRSAYFSDYVGNCLLRDVRDFTKIDKVDTFMRFLSYMASCTGKELNFLDIGKSVGISSPTAKRWATALEAVGVICVIPAYADYGSGRVVKSSKFYFADTGLASFLCGFKSGRDIIESNIADSFFETYVVTEIVKSYYGANESLNLFYYRDTKKREIDLVIPSGSKLYPIEIRMNRVPNKPEKNLSVLDKYGMDVQPAVVICLSDIFMPYGKSTWLFPASAL